jgi:hypothetical protein
MAPVIAPLLSGNTKRTAVTGFAILYVLLVCAISDYRMSAWLDAASNRQHSVSNTGIDKVKVFVPHHRDARILQNQFVVEAPNITAGISFVIDRYLFLAADLQDYGQSPIRIPCRAPPSLS